MNIFSSLYHCPHNYITTSRYSLTNSSQSFCSMTCSALHGMNLFTTCLNLYSGSELKYVPAHCDEVGDAIRDTESGHDLLQLAHPSIKTCCKISDLTCIGTVNQPIPAPEPNRWSYYCRYRWCCTLQDSWSCLVSSSSVSPGSNSLCGSLIVSCIHRTCILKKTPHSKPKA